MTIEQKAELFEIRRKMLQERSNMRFQLKELDAMTPRENNSSKSVSFVKIQVSWQSFWWHKVPTETLPKKLL